MRKNSDPIAAARELRKKFAKNLPRSKAEMNNRNVVTLSQMTALIQEKTYLESHDAYTLCRQIFPELTVVYWDSPDTWEWGR